MSALHGGARRAWPQWLLVMQDIMFVDTQHYSFYSWQALEHHARLLTDELLGVPAAHMCPECPCKALPWPCCDGGRACSCWQDAADIPRDTSSASISFTSVRNDKAGPLPDIKFPQHIVLL